MYRRSISHRQFEIGKVLPYSMVAVAISHSGRLLAIACDVRRKLEVHGRIELKPRFTLYERAILG
ncbi:hypothetical protein WS75_26035 [Burkholderia sp. FL-7-2-10-S1-D7]|nr:hypothetical protein WS75_26035 [Burkholderia sp. FL-7-2-10-S1-D7]